MLSAQSGISGIGSHTGKMSEITTILGTLFRLTNPVSGTRFVAAVVVVTHA